MIDRLRKRRARARRRQLHIPAGPERLESRRVLSLNYGTAFGLGGTDVAANAVAVDPVGNTYLAGTFSGTQNFNPSGTTNLTSQGSRDIFVAKYSPGGTLLWAKDFGGAGADVANAIAVDAQGRIDVAGQFQGSATFGGTTLTSAGSGLSAVVFQLDAAGGVAWAQMGTSGDTGGTASNDFVNGLAADAAGNVYATGQYQGTAAFGSGAALSVTSQTTGSSAFVTKYSAAGAPQWVDAFGPTGADVAGGLGATVDPSGNVAVVGTFTGTASFTAPGGQNVGTNGSPQTSNGAYDAWVARFDPAGNLNAVRSFGGPTTDSARSVVADSAGNLYVTGNYSNTVDFGNGHPLTSQTPNNGLNAFIVRLNNAGLSTAWADGFGGTQPATAAGIATDGAGDIYALGQFITTASAQPSGPTLSVSGTNPASFLLRLDTAGNIDDAVSAGGPGGGVNPTSLAVNASGTVATAGSYTAAGGGPTFGTTTLPNLGASNAFVAQRESIRGDFLGNGTQQLTVFQPSTATFAIQNLGYVQFGQGTLYGGNPIPLVANYSAPGFSNAVIFQPSTSTFFVQGVGSFQFGQGTAYGGDPIPLVGDYAGRGTDQLIVFQPSTSTFFVQGVGSFQFGQGTLYGGDPVPLVGDFLGNGRDQLAVFQPSTSTFFVQGVGSFQFGQGTLYGGDPVPVVGDFNGSGTDQLAVFQPSTATFAIQNVGYVQFGQGTAYGGDPIPLAVDLQGNGKALLAVFQPSTSTFAVQNTGYFQFGQGTLYGGNPVPVPLAAGYTLSGNSLVQYGGVSAAAVPLTMILPGPDNGTTTRRDRHDA